MDNQEEYKGYIIEILPDEDPESPREWDNLGKMIMFHRRYNLPNEFQEGLMRADDFENYDEMREEIILQAEAVVILPVFMYEHSGVTLKTKDFNDPFDSGQVGFIYASREDVKKEYNVKRITKKTLESVKGILENEVEVYSQYLEGDVWGFRISKEEFCKHCGVTRDDTIDSCWGFYGQEAAIGEAKMTIDNFPKDCEAKNGN